MTTNENYQDVDDIIVLRSNPGQVSSLTLNRCGMISFAIGSLIFIIGSILMAIPIFNDDNDSDVYNRTGIIFFIVGSFIFFFASISMVIPMYRK